MFRLPEDFTMNTLAELRPLLLEALERDESVQLDGRAVREVDVAGLQLLCAARRQAALFGKSIGFAPECRGAVIEAAMTAVGLARPRPCDSHCLCVLVGRG